MYLSTILLSLSVIILLTIIASKYADCKNLEKILDYKNLRLNQSEDNLNWYRNECKDLRRRKTIDKCSVKELFIEILRRGQK